MDIKLSMSSLLHEIEKKNSQKQKIRLTKTLEDDETEGKKY